jgi:putative hydrolase of the HAD superfamily
MTRPVRHLLSDLGGVVLHLDFDLPAARTLARCEGKLPPTTAEFRTWFESDPILALYETGQLTREEFLHRVRQGIGFRGTDEEFVAIWRQMFRPNRGIVQAWHEFSRVVHIWYLSNTSEMHVPWVYQAFPEIAVHSGDALSYVLGVRKPDEAFFHRALERLGLDPAECVFVDDDPANCQTARRLGIRAWVHTDNTGTIAWVRSCLPKGLCR